MVTLSISDSISIQFPKELEQVPSPFRWPESQLLTTSIISPSYIKNTGVSISSCDPISIAK
jgi:hypothetical protein